MLVNIRQVIGLPITTIIALLLILVTFVISLFNIHTGMTLFMVMLNGVIACFLAFYWKIGQEKIQKIGAIEKWMESATESCKMYSSTADGSTTEFGVQKMDVMRFLYENQSTLNINQYKREYLHDPQIYHFLCNIERENELLARQPF